MSSRAASSDVAASLVTLSLALLGGLIAYNFTSTYLASQGSHAVLIVNANAALSPDGVILVVSIKNICQREVSSVTLELDGYVVATVEKAIPPGASASFTVMNPPSVWVYGASKGALLKATFTDKSTSTIIFPVSTVGFQSTVSDQTGNLGDRMGQPNPGRRILFLDTFDAGLSGWFLWGNPEGYNIEVSNHGKPAPCLHIFGNGPRGAVAGAAKNVRLPDNITTGQLTVQLMFDYNVHGLPDRGDFKGNLWLRIDGDGEMLFNVQIYDAKSACSGWGDAEARVVLPEPAPEILTLIIYTVDRSDRLQEFWIDNICLEF